MTLLLVISSRTGLIPSGEKNAANDNTLLRVFSSSVPGACAIFFQGRVVNYMSKHALMHSNIIRRPCAFICLRV